MLREVHLRGLNKDVHLWQVQGFLDSTITPKAVRFIDGEHDKTATFLMEHDQMAALLAPKFRSKLQAMGMSIYIPQIPGVNLPSATQGKTITIPAPISHAHSHVPSDQNGSPRNLYFTGLPKALTQDQFRMLAEKWGPVEHSMLLSVLDGMGRRRGFVIYDEHEIAKKAMSELNGAKISGHIIDVSWAMVQRYSKTGPATHRDNTIPNRLHHPPQRQTLSEIQVELSGPSTNPNLPARPTSSSVQAKTSAISAGQSDQELAAVKLQNMVANLAKSPASHNSKILLVENLPSVFVSDYNISQLFKTWGSIKRCLLFPAMLANATPTGYIEFLEPESADLCLEACNGLPLGDQILSVRYLTDREAFAMGWAAEPIYPSQAIFDDMSNKLVDTSFSSKDPWDGWEVDGVTPETSWEQVEKLTKVDKSGDAVKAPECSL